MEDLIRNVHTLFDDEPSTSPPVPSSAAEAAAETPSTPSSFSSLPSDVTLESRLTPSPTALPSPLLGPNTLVEGVETSSRE